MSTLNVSNITDGTDTVETGYVLNGSAKAFSNIDQTSSHTIRSGSLNTSSVTDDGAGISRINYTSGFDNTNYVHVATTSGSAGSNGDHSFVPHTDGAGHTTTTSHQVRTSQHAGTRQDAKFLMHATLGDLA